VVAHHDSLIRRQFESCEDPDAREGSVAGGGHRQGDAWMGEWRRTFQNVRHLNLTLGFMRAQIVDHADPVRYAEINRARARAR
jgi:hypothetical protein